MKNAIFVMLEDYADWEYGYLASQLNKSVTWNVKTCSTTKLVASIGGFETRVNYLIDELAEPCDLLVLIGGNSWKIKNEPLKKFIATHLAANKPTAAICGAVDYLAENGLLLHYKHTGNAQYLWHDFKEYTNQTEFIPVQAVHDRNLVTANGTAALEFTNLVLKMIHFLPNSEVDKATDLYKLGFYKYCDKYGNPFA